MQNHDNKKMLDYYAARAAEYDTIYRKPERQDDLRHIEQWLPALFQGLDVLEVACGTGYWTRLYAPRASSVLATDATTETLAVAESRVAGNNVAFRVADAYALPRTDERFNGGFAGFWISHVPKARLREFLTGLHAALTPGATVVLLDNRYVEGSSTPISERDAEGNTYQIRLFRDGTAHRILKNFPSEEEMREALDGRYSEFRYTAWQYYWAIRYAIP